MRRTERLDIPLTPDEKAAIQHAAGRQHHNAAPWARALLLAAAAPQAPVQVARDGRDE